MKYLKTNSIIIKIFVFICSFIIVFMSPCARYFDVYHIEKVNATGGVVAVEGAVVAWEWLMGLLASAGLGTVAYENREALAASYDEYLQAQIDTDMFVAHKVEDTCIQLYDKASDTIQSIPWEDYLNSINEFHDVAVDELTDVYVKVAPSLLGTFEDFVTSIFAGETVVPGISDYIEEQSICFTGYDAIKNSSGNYVYHGVSSYYHKNDGLVHIVYSMECPYLLVCDGTWFRNVDHDLNAYDVNYKKYNNGILTYSGSQPALICRSNSDFVSGFSLSLNMPMYNSIKEARSAVESGDLSGALNYSRSIYDNITDNDDLPTIGRFGRELWEQVANAPDWGIGSYGDGVIVNDWATDLPFVGLDDLWNYALTAEDVYDKVIDDIINGVYDPTVDIPDTYDDAWHDVIDKGWDDVIDNPVNNPADDPTKPVDPSKPVNPDIPLNPDIPIDDVIDIPVEDVVPTVNDSLFDVAGSIRYKFPFSIPWDLRYLFTVLADTPKAPYFELPIVIERYGINEKIIVDLKPFEKLSVLSRSLFSLLFAIGLIKLTFLVVGMRKEE